MNFYFEVRSKFIKDKTWNNTIDFCEDHDEYIPHVYQKVILKIASDYGLYRKLSLLDDCSGMKLEAKFPTSTIFSDWLSARIRYFYEVKNSEIFEDSDEVPVFPNSFQKHCWVISNFTPLIPNEQFWKHVMMGIEKSNKLCYINLSSFSNDTQRSFYDRFYS